MNLKTESMSCETDLCIMQYGSWRGIEIGIGECKSEKGSITQDDVEHLAAIRENLVAKGLNCYLIFSKSADAFDTEELELFRGLKKERIPLILLLNKELEADEPYSKYTDSQLRSRFVGSLEEMARNSMTIHFPEEQLVGIQRDSPPNDLIAGLFDCCGRNKCRTIRHQVL